MGKSPPDIRLVLIILLFLFGPDAAGILYGAELPGLEYPPGENQQEQNQEITQETLKIKVDVAQVTVDVTVRGTPVSELQLDDFTVYDNGVAQNVSHFSRDKIPLAVAFLIDLSGSEIPYLPALKIAALSALRRLRPEDQVALFVFDSNPAKLSNLTEDRLIIGKNINALTIKQERSTNIFDTIYDAARYLARNAPNRRRAIILVSDNCQTMSGKTDADDARVEMLEASATLYGIKTAGDICVESRDQVKSIASETGGEILDVSAPTSLQTALEKTTSNLRQQYTLGFSPSNLGEEGSFHKLTVKIAAKDRCPGCQLLARSGYYAGITAPSPPQDDIPLKLNDSAEKTNEILIQRLILTAGTTELDLTDIPFTVQTLNQTDSMGQPQLRIDLKIDFAQIGLAIVNDRRPCKLHIVVFYANEKRKILGSDWKKLEGLLSEETYNQIREGGISVSTTIPIKAQNQILKVVVYDEENDRVGSKLVRLDKKANRN
jgi:Ca-activated chloride channel homolog